MDAVVLSRIFYEEVVLSIRKSKPAFIHSCEPFLVGVSEDVSIYLLVGSSAGWNGKLKMYNANETKLLSTREAARALGYSYDYVSKMCRQGYLKAVRDGNSWLIAPADLEAFKKAHETKLESYRALAERRARAGAKLRFLSSSCRKTFAGALVTVLLLGGAAAYAQTPLSVLPAAASGAPSGATASAYEAGRSLLASGHAFLNSFFESLGETLLALIGTNIAYAPQEPIPFFPARIGTTTAVTNSYGPATYVTNSYVTNPVSYIYSGTGGATIAYVQKAMDNLRRDLAERDDDGGSTGGGISDISGSSIEELSDVSSMTESFGDVFIWDGSAWTNAATSTLGIALGDTTGTLGASRGGTGQSGYAIGDILYADSATTLAALPAGLPGQVLKIAGGVPMWGADATGSGGSGAFSTSSDSLSIYPTDTYDVVIIGAAATSTTGNILEVVGNTLFRNALTSYGTLTAPRYVATTSVASVFPYASSTALSSAYASSTNAFFGNLSIGSLSGVLKATAGTVSTAIAGTDYESPLSFVYPLVRTVNSISFAFGTTTANTWGAQNTFTGLFATNASSTNATTTSLGINSETFTDLTGSGLQNIGGALSISTAGDWTGTFDGAEGSFYLARANHTGTQLASTISDFNSAVASYINASTTLWDGTTESSLEAFLTDVTNVFTNNDGALADDDLSNNSIEDLSDVATMTENFGDLLYWNGSTWADIATSSLGISSGGGITAIGPAAQTADGPTVTLATSTSANNGLTSNLVITGSGDTLTYTSSLSGTLTNAGLQNSTVSYGGVTLALGASDATPAFDLTDATNLNIVNGTTGTLTVARGGSGTTTAPSGQVLYGGGAGVYQSVATSSLAVSGAFSYSGTLGALLGGANGTLSLATNGVALTNLAQIAANTILGNPTGASGNVQAVATSTFYGAGIGGQVLTWNNGVPQWVSTTTAGTGLTYNAGSPGNFSVNTSQNISTLSNLTSNGLIKTSGGTGALSIATPGTDYIAGGAGAATTTVTCSGGASCTGFVAFGSAPIIISSTAGLSIYDAWTHPSAGQSATTSLMLFNGAASSTQFSAAQAYFGGTATSTFTTAGFLGIASSSPWGLLSVNPSALGSGVPSFVVGSSTATRFIVADSGNVGVGLVSPNNKFSVLAGNGPGNQTIAGFGANNTQDLITIGYNTLTATSSLLGSTFGDLEITARSNNDILLNPFGGSVGIGTTSPYKLLSVYGPGAGTQQVVISASDDADASIRFENGGQRWNIGRANTAGSVAGDFFIFDSEGTAGTRLLIQSSTGNVGIGTTTPQWKLNVASASTPQLTLSDASATAAPFNFRTVNSTLYISTSSPTTFATTTSPIFTLNGATASTTIQKLSVTTTGTSSFAGGVQIQSGGLSLGSTLSGLLKATSGAITGTVSGTDYVAGGTGSANQVSYFTGTGAIAGDAGMTYDATADRLTVTYASTTAISGTSSHFGVVRAGGAASSYSEFGNNGTTNYWSSITDAASIFTGGSERLRILTSGNVGIGSTSPNANLVVQTSGSTGSAALGSWVGSSNYGTLYLNNSFANSSNYNLLSGQSGVDLNLYVNRPSGAGIKFREANSSTDQFTLLTGGSGIFPDGNLTVCTGGACPSGTPAGNGNIIAETAIGIASSTPWAGLSIASGKAIVAAENTLATSTSMTVDWRNGNQQLVRLGTAGTTISFSGFIEGQKLVLTVCNPNATAGAISWGTQVLWSGGTAPTQTTTANKCDVWSFLATMATSSVKVFGTQTSNF